MGERDRHQAAIINLFPPKLENYFIGAACNVKRWLRRGAWQLQNVSTGRQENTSIFIPDPLSFPTSGCTARNPMRSTLFDLRPPSVPSSG